MSVAKIFTDWARPLLEYYVPDSKRGQLEYHAALRTHILSYDWLSGGSGPEGEWDDELDDPRTWAD